MDDWPREAAAVSAAWLTECLRETGMLDGGTRVAHVGWEKIGTGQVGDTARFVLTYEGPRPGPASLAGKFASADPTSRGTAAAFGLYRKEVGFYRELLGETAIRSPRPLAARISDDGADFVLLFEDLGPARGGNQLDGCSLQDAREAIRQAAALHAPTRGHPGVLAADCLVPRPEAMALLRQLYPQAQATFRDRYEGLLEPELMAVCEGLAAEADRYFGREPSDPCLVHGDFRLDNMLFDVRGGAEPIAVVDWQTAAIGNGLTDIGYFLGCGVGNALRRAHETELLDLYCEEMSERGVPLTRAQVFDDYRLGALHGVSTAVFSAANVVRTERGDANFLSMARGACGLALDHDSLGALRAAG